MEIRDILLGSDEAAKRYFFSFNSNTSIDAIILKFNLWARYFFVKYFTSDDAAFHRDIDENNVKLYRGELTYLINSAFRGAAKTARAKLFIAYCVTNDTEHMRRYFKVLAEDLTNAKQIVTDVYNMFVDPRVRAMYPEVFEKSDAKREETMGSFTTATGVKIIADTVGTNQRGALQDDARPDFVWFEDFENRTTLRSARKTLAIWQNMEEARTGIALGGACLYTCNYISEQGNVHKIITNQWSNKKVLIIPIEDELHNSAWPDRYGPDDIAQMRKDDDDFEGERMCRPSASKDIYFDRATLDEMSVRLPIEDSNGFRIFKKFDPSHRYAGGHDIAGGVGLDSSTSVFIDFDTIPAQVVGVYANNEIKPEAFGHEILREADKFGGCLVAPERNYGTEAILVLKQQGANLFAMPNKDSKIKGTAPSEYGWHTNQLTKPKMLAAVGKAIEDGLLALNDEALIREFKNYTRNDLLTYEKDPRLTTRHFDLVMACAIAWQMKDYATVTTVKNIQSYKDQAQEYMRAGKPDEVVNDFMRSARSYIGG